MDRRAAERVPKGPTKGQQGGSSATKLAKRKAQKQGSGRGAQAAEGSSKKKARSSPEPEDSDDSAESGDREKAGKVRAGGEGGSAQYGKSPAEGPMTDSAKPKRGRPRLSEAERAERKAQRVAAKKEAAEASRRIARLGSGGREPAAAAAAGTSESAAAAAAGTSESAFMELMSIAHSVQRDSGHVGTAAGSGGGAAEAHVSVQVLHLQPPPEELDIIPDLECVLCDGDDGSSAVGSGLQQIVCFLRSPV